MIDFRINPMLVELPLARIQHLALYTDMSSFEIAMVSIVKDNDRTIDTTRGLRKMAQDLVRLTRNTQLDDIGYTL